MSALEIIDVSLDFGGVRALDGVSKTFEEGGVYGVIGPNGSGKSTLLNVLSGFYAPTAGVVRFDGEQVSGRPPAQLRRKGIVRSFQNLRIYSDLSVLDNLLLALHPELTEKHGEVGSWLRLSCSSRTARAQERESRDRVLSALETHGMQCHPGRRAGDLSYGQLKQLELIRSAIAQPRVLLLDEPTSGLNPEEAEEMLGALLGSLNRSTGLIVVIVEHRLDLLLEVCDSVTVLDAGSILADGIPSQVMADDRVLDVYIGRPDRDRS